MDTKHAHLSIYIYIRSADPAPSDRLSCTVHLQP